jgi:hypothetical protein
MSDRLNQKKKLNIQSFACYLMSESEYLTLLKDFSAIFHSFQTLDFPASCLTTRASTREYYILLVT